jgi:Tol biopolymer transport system component
MPFYPFLLGGIRRGWVFKTAAAPDQRRIAFYWNHPDAPGIWVASLDGGAPRQVAEGSELWALGWSQDGGFIFAADRDSSPHRVVRIAVEGRSEESLFELPFDTDSSDPGSFDPTGKRFVFTRVDRKSDVWVAENFDPGP